MRRFVPNGHLRRNGHVHRRVKDLCKGLLPSGQRPLPRAPPHLAGFQAPKARSIPARAIGPRIGKALEKLKPSEATRYLQKVRTIHSSQGPTARAMPDTLMDRAFSPRDRGWHFLPRDFPLPWALPRADMGTGRWPSPSLDFPQTATSGEMAMSIVE